MCLPLCQRKSPPELKPDECLYLIGPSFDGPDLFYLSFCLQNQGKRYKTPHKGSWTLPVLMLEMDKINRKNHESHSC